MDNEQIKIIQKLWKRHSRIDDNIKDYVLEWNDFKNALEEYYESFTVKLPVKPAKAGKRVFEQNIVNKMEGKPENELSNDAEIRFELDNVKYNVKINDDDELEIYKIALKYTQQDQIVLKAKSQNVICIS